MKNRTRALAVFATLTAVALTGCADKSTADNDQKLAPMHAEDLQRMKGTGSFNDFENQVLEDNWVTDEEWNQAKNLYYVCMNQYGLEGLILDTALGAGATHADQDKFAANYPPEDRTQALDKLSQIESDCATGTVINVGTYYFGPRNNPDGVEYFEAVRRCIAKTSFASEFAGLNDEEMDQRLSELTAYSATPELLPCIDGIYGDW